MVESTRDRVACGTLRRVHILSLPRVQERPAAVKVMGVACECANIFASTLIMLCRFTLDSGVTLSAIKVKDFNITLACSGSRLASVLSSGTGSFICTAPVPPSKTNSQSFSTLCAFCVIMTSVSAAWCAILSKDDFWSAFGKRERVAREKRRVRIAFRFVKDGSSFVGSSNHWTWSSLQVRFKRICTYQPKEKRDEAFGERPPWKYLKMVCQSLHLRRHRSPTLPVFATCVSSPVAPPPDYYISSASSPSPRDHPSGVPIRGAVNCDSRTP